jgi:hypothetical protein
MLRRLVLLALVVLVSGRAQAAVTEFQQISRTDIEGYPYERITGRITYRVDPEDVRNRGVVDLDKAPRDLDGWVTFSGDIVIIRPKTGGNGMTIIDVANRGRATVFGFNRARGGNAITGDGFLLTRGYTLVIVGWEFDAPRGENQVTLDAPVATDHGVTITGLVHASFTPDRPEASVTVRDLAAYPPVDAAGLDSQLTMRERPEEAGTALPRTEWQLNGNVVTLTGGFAAGRIYDLTYRAANPRVGGAGFVAVRDVAAWLKRDQDAAPRAQYVLGFGMSQSGRFLRDFLYQGFNTDEQGRQALDAVMIQIAGAARTDLNERFGTPVSLGTHTATSFPFADTAQRDPITGISDGELDNPRARLNQPKIFYTNTGVEYWGGGRAAALVHVSPDGTRDIPLPPNVRFYFMAGAQHGPAAFPPAAVTNVQQRQNPTDYWWTLRALLVAMDGWVRNGTEPPASAYPTLRDGTLVAADKITFRAIPGVHSPATIWGGRRVANGLTAQAGSAGTPLPHLVPQVDADGNERAGIRLPEVDVPLATYTGWNFRSAATGRADDIRPLIGSYVPFAVTQPQRDTTKDPRRSIAERYANEDAYLEHIRAAERTLVRSRYILAEDVPAIEARALEHWRVATEAAIPSTR